MAAELGLLSLTQLQKLAQKQQEPGPAPMWQWAGTRRPAEDDDSWEARAFAEDTGSALGTTWPPRSYTCAFCRREFRSAQALGGHMNVHRRDRARLRQSPQEPDPSSSSVTPSPPILFPSPELVANGGLCFFYPIPPHGTVFAPAANSSSTLLSASHAANTVVSPPTMLNFPSIVRSDPSPCESNNLDSEANDDEIKDSKQDMDVVEELDLELRLGW